VPVSVITAAQLDQVQEQPAGDRLLRRRQGRQGRIGAPCDRNLYAGASGAPQRLIGRQWEVKGIAKRPRSPLQALPKQHQCLLDQWQDAGRPGGVHHQPLDQRGLDLHSDIRAGRTITCRSPAASSGTTSTRWSWIWGHSGDAIRSG
jgi:hypothetical protein